jgi:hypothetical protein
MSSWLDEQMKAEQFRDMIHAVERRRLVQRSVVARHQPLLRLYWPALAWLGRRLERWGYQLQTRYGAIAEVGVVTRVSNGRGGCS